MTTLVHQRAIVRVLTSSLLLFAVFIHGAQAQPAGALTGTVLDDSGSVIASARITISDARGSVVQTTSTDRTGVFGVRGLAPGGYVVLVESPSLLPASGTVTVVATGQPPAMTFTLKPAGFAETVVVTARRAETRLAETPQKIEVIDSVDLERSVAADLTDILKKNAGVDVVQYSGVLSGIGIRGFRPQTGGINKRSLLLIDGRPSGVTNLATLLVDNVERIEVLKGTMQSNAQLILGPGATLNVPNLMREIAECAFGPPEGGTHTRDRF